MNDEIKLSGTEIIGRRIVAIYHEDLRLVKRFQDRRVIVRLESGLFFCLDDFKDNKRDKTITIFVWQFKPTFLQVLSIEKEKNLDSPIKALVSCDTFDIEGAVLLENEYVITQGIAEFQAFYEFYRPSEKDRNYTELEIVDC